MSGKELIAITQAHHNGALSGDGPFTRLCHNWLEQQTTAKKVLLTHSCTAALEMAAILLKIEPGDEIIMPSYTFVSTANAFVLRGGVPVFIDIREDTLNLDEMLIEAAITPKTKAIVPVHYAGVACEMDSIMNIASSHQLTVIEDAAQGIMSKYNNRSLGSIGSLGAYSFHETKNIISGEGGALLINDPSFVKQAEIIREKGTDRSSFFRGEVDKYTWQSIGSSFLPGEIIAAFLSAQLEESETITKKRLTAWHHYHTGLEHLENRGLLRRPIIPHNCEHNGHMYYILLPNSNSRQKVATSLKKFGIHAISHYVPLHQSPAGKALCSTRDLKLPITESIADRILRLPMWAEINSSEIEYVIKCLNKTLCP
jgi:dTDP-4-amino-4,6-dideoxygalactose transaminase